jgi:hypothetical protein
MGTFLINLHVLDVTRIIERCYGGSSSAPPRGRAASAPPMSLSSRCTQLASVNPVAYPARLAGRDRGHVVGVSSRPRWKFLWIRPFGLRVDRCAGARMPFPPTAPRCPPCGSCEAVPIESPAPRRAGRVSPPTPQEREPPRLAATCDGYGVPVHQGISLGVRGRAVCAAPPPGCTCVEDDHTDGQRLARWGPGPISGRGRNVRCSCPRHQGTRGPVLARCS